MFKRVLVPMDGTAVAVKALEAGRRMASGFGADLCALSLQSSLDEMVGSEDLIRRQVEATAPDAEVDIRHLNYSVVEDIAAEVDRVPDTLVVIATDARGRAAVFNPNTAEELMRFIRRPVMTIGPDLELGAEWPSGPIVVSTDGSPFAESVGDLSVALADGLELELMLVTVIDSTKVPSSVPVAAESNTLLRMIDRLRAADPAGRAGLSPGYDTLHGADPGRAIVDYANSIGAAFIVMATHGRSGLQRAALGSVAMSVVRHAHCPVVLSRPA